MFVDRLDERLGRPRVDPHGDPIPGPDLRLQYPETELLCRVPASAEVRLEQVDDSVPEALRVLADRRVEIGAQVTVLEAAGGDVVLAPVGERSASGFRVVHEHAHAMRVSLL